MHQLHEETPNLKSFGFRAKIPQIRMGVIQQGKCLKMHAHVVPNMILVHNQAS
jgi:carotenoid cleavage dioxygenase-like enzyme